MQVALIPPRALSSLCVGRPFQMCIAPEALEDKEYAYAYNMMSARSHVILDNGAWEHTTIPVSQLIMAQERTGAKELVIPDIQRNDYATIDLARTSIPVLKGRGVLHAVAQGKGMREWLSCYKALHCMPEIEVIGLPRNLDVFWSPGGRLGCTLFLQRFGLIDPDRKYHLMGIGADPLEILFQSQYPWIRSVDTSAPFTAAFMHRRWDLERLPIDKNPREKGYLDVKLLDGVAYEAALHNVQMLDEWAHG